MGNPLLLSKGDLEKRVINKEGKLNLDASLKDLVTYIGYKSKDNKEGFRFSTYCALLYKAPKYIKKIHDLEKFREEGIRRSPLAKERGFWKNSAEELNRALSNYGVKPIPWVARKYKAWELRKKYEEKYGENYWRYI